MDGAHASMSIIPNQITARIICNIRQVAMYSCDPEESKHQTST